MDVEQDSLAALERARARITAQTEKARAAAAEAAEMAVEARTTQYTATSPRREVSVTARADGVIENVEVRASAMELDERALSTLLSETVREAQRSAAWAGARRVERTLGADSAFVAEMDAYVRAQFPPVTGWR